MAPDIVGDRSLQTHIEEMRNLTLCKICLRPFYEPYILGCGHTFCYSCLKSWFGGSSTRGKNKNCPDCRTAVRVAPAPNYLLRDLTHLFVGRVELLPEMETIEEHDRDKATEAQMVLSDRNGSGLFSGAFKTPSWLPSVSFSAPIRDAADNVFRCPTCMWELEEGECGRCGWGASEGEDIEFSGSDDEDDDDDSELSLESSDLDSDDAAELAAQVTAPQLNNGTPHFYGLDIGSEDESETDDSQLGAYDQHDDFIDNEAEDDADDMDGDEIANYPDVASTPYSDDTSYASEHEPRGHTSTARTSTTSRVIHDSDDEDDPGNTVYFESDIEEPQARVPQRRRPIVISDDEDEEEEEGISHTSSTERVDTVRDSGSANGATGGDESEDAESGSESEATESSESESGDSDDTIGPPQTVRNRRKHLQEQRARRPQTSHVIGLRTSAAGHHRRRERTTAVH